MRITCLYLLALLTLQCSLGFAQPVKIWLTTGDSSILFSQQPQGRFMNGEATGVNTIRVDESRQYQQIDGFGFALTQGSALPILRMSPSKRKQLLESLFDTTKDHIGISYLRLSIGASDLNDAVYSYDDVPMGETDTSLSKFSLERDRKEVLPILKEILAINRSIKILASPWSPPAWMKTNNDTRGGRLQPAFYRAYAHYLLRYLQEMRREGIRIDAITVQNEPLHPGNNPSLLMTAPEQAAFVRDHLGPVFRKNGNTTKIIIYDHNADRPDYPIFVLNDPKARQYVDGSGFHLYNGDVSALTTVHDAHPDKHIYFTEQMVIQFGPRREKEKAALDIAEPVARLFIGAPRNWARNVLEWNLAANAAFTPFTDRGGCNICQGAITIEGDSVTRNLAYYAMAHASKLVRPGAYRIASSELAGLDNVAFRNADGSKVLIVANTSGKQQTFTIRYGSGMLKCSLGAGDVATYWWK